MTVVSNIFLACLIASQWILLYGLCCENVLRYLGFNKKSISCDGTPAFENDAPIEKNQGNSFSGKYLLNYCLVHCMCLQNWKYGWQWSWWRDDMETFSALLALCEGNPSSVVPPELERSATHIIFDGNPNKLLNKQTKDGRIFLNPVTISQGQTTTFMVHYFCSLLIFVATFGVCKMNLNVMMWYDTEYIEADWRIYAPVKQTLVQILARRLFGAKPLSEPMLSYCHLDHKERILVKFRLKFKSFHSRKYTWNCRLRNGGHFVSTSMC